MWDFWLGVYYQSFPDNERMMVQYLTSLLGENGDDAVFVGVSEWNHQPAGIALYKPRPENNVVDLWYLAVAPELRGTGAGTALFGEVVKASVQSGCRLLVWEVELPEGGDDPAPERRIGWYKRLGGKKLQGIRYHVSVDKPLPPLPMGLMVLRLNEQEENADTVYGLLKAFYGDNLEQDGVLRLV